MAEYCIRILRCDRCGETARNDEYKTDHFKYWGHFRASHVDGYIDLPEKKPKRVYPESTGDLCPDCMDKLNGWWVQGREVK